MTQTNLATTDDQNEGSVERSEGWTTRASKSVKKLGALAEEKTDTALHSLAEGLTALGGKIREKAPHENILNKATHVVADAVADVFESSGKALSHHAPGEFRDKASNLMKRNPIVMLGAGVGLGFVLGRLFWPSSKR